MSEIKLGSMASEFTLTANGGSVINISDFHGKRMLGVERSTFIINEEGLITYVFRKVKAAGHASKVLKAII